MNGRVYAPVLGHFLSVAPFIQGNGNSQGLNPYSYILNNPLAGVDPTGYEVACDGNTGTTCAKQEAAKDIQAKDVKRIHIDKTTGKVIVVKKDGSTVEVGQFVKRGISAGATVISANDPGRRGAVSISTVRRTATNKT
ncbi:MAG: hypothetical protein D6694_01905 [Gammaproteobacteria bacterium]|nr:MAG: hypothetical protein D6694_01905 [Gammaproteobacteria bacterium]